MNVLNILLTCSILATAQIYSMDKAIKQEEAQTSLAHGGS